MTATDADELEVGPPGVERRDLPPGANALEYRFLDVVEYATSLAQQNDFPRGRVGEQLAVVAVAELLLKLLDQLYSAPPRQPPRGLP